MGLYKESDMLEFEKDVELKFNCNEVKKNEGLPKATLHLVDENN
ncbi:MAG: hypothetical protein ACJAUP_001296 [Cellvibrionaceae bacterium]|jgi:hypothetical protein